MMLIDMAILVCDRSGGCLKPMENSDIVVD